MKIPPVVATPMQPLVRESCVGGLLPAPLVAQYETGYVHAHHPYCPLLSHSEEGHSFTKNLSLYSPIIVSALTTCWIPCPNY